MVLNLKEQVKNMQMIYQLRYAQYLKKYDENNNDMDSHGHAMECSYILINLFGLTDDEVKQLEKNNYAGLLDSDLEE